MTVRGDDGDEGRARATVISEFSVQPPQEPLREAPAPTTAASTAAPHAPTHTQSS